MEFLSERILRLAGLDNDKAEQLNEGLAEEAVETHQPYQTKKTTESGFYVEGDEEGPVEGDHHKITVDYAIKESNRALVESRLRAAIRAELKAILEESDSDERDEEGLKYGATGLKRVTRSGRRVHMGGVGVGFASWNK
jgi:hypothetical protein